MTSESLRPRMAHQSRAAETARPSRSPATRLPAAAGGAASVGADEGKRNQVEQLPHQGLYPVELGGSHLERGFQQTADFVGARQRSVAVVQQLFNRND